MCNYKEQALQEYNSEATAAHPGGVNGRPFWNVNASQFTFAPSFQFPSVPYSGKYRFTATDRNGAEHVFEADQPTASLAPIWGEIPTGFVTLKVESLGNLTGKVQYLIGARTFFKSEPFPGRDAYPPRPRSYREAARMAYRFVFEDDMVHHWLTHGTPKPDYAHNVYPSKTISSVIHAMITYASIDPEKAEDALTLARRAADFLLSISFPVGHPLEGLPPTYSFEGLDEEAVNKVARAAKGLVGTVMMLYPVSAGLAYLDLAQATKDEKYFAAALKIADFYKKNRHPSGSWYLVYDCATGAPTKDNLCMDFQFVDFFHLLHERTGDVTWKQMEEDYLNFIKETCLKDYTWDAQFEDSPIIGNYGNLAHFTASRYIRYIAENQADDPQAMEAARDLMRFVEDQFVVWGEFAYWSEEKIRERHTPAGLEQYFCYRPIDANTALITQAFRSMYQATGERLYLEKALTLADVIARRQHEDGGIPTFFEGENCAHGRRNYWINCQVISAGTLKDFADLTEAEGIE